MSGRDEKKKKYLLAVSMKKKRNTCGSANSSTSNNNNNNNINLTLYEFGSRQTVLTIATKLYIHTIYSVIQYLFEPMEFLLGD
jgi:hypothetical protein